MRRNLPLLAVIPLLALGACSTKESVDADISGFRSASAAAATQARSASAALSSAASTYSANASSALGSASSSAASSYDTSMTSSASSTSDASASSTGAASSGSTPSFTEGDLMEQSFVKLAGEMDSQAFKDTNRAKKEAGAVCAGLSGGGSWQEAKDRVAKDVPELSESQAGRFVALSVTTLCSDQTKKVTEQLG